MSRKQLTQYEVNHVENRTLVDSEWPDEREDWADCEFEEDDIDDW